MDRAMEDSRKQDGGDWVEVRKEFTKAYSTAGIQVGGIRRKGRRERNRR